MPSGGSCRRCWTGSAPAERFVRARAGHRGIVFLFSSRLGCLGSLLISLVLTVLLFVLFSVL